MTFDRLLVTAVLAVAAGCSDDNDCMFYPTGATDLAPALQLRDPTTGVCQAYGGGGECDSCGRCYDVPTGAAEAFPDWGQCFTNCESLDEATCQATAGCRAAFAGGTFHECWAVAPSGPVRGGDCGALDAQECSRHDDCIARHAIGSPIGVFQSCAAESTTPDPGSCIGAITCGTAPPACPADTLPGRRNGCWTGFCIPIAQCDALPACSELDEMDCIRRTDCAPTYRGQNCTCTPTSCTCQSWVFDACEVK